MSLYVLAQVTLAVMVCFGTGNIGCVMGCLGTGNIGCGMVCLGTGNIGCVNDFGTCNFVSVGMMADVLVFA